MPRFYSPEWIAAFNDAVAETSGRPEDPSRFRVAQVVTGGPGGDVRVVLDVDGDRLRLERQDLAEGTGSPETRAPTGPDGAGPAHDGPDGERAPDVTVLVSYEDAAALSRGEVDAATLIGAGRLTVRGNLSLLVAGQARLVAAAERLGELTAATTY